MISFETLRLEEDRPIYLQIIRHIQRGIVSGAIQDGDELPSRRVLSARLGVNPNTIQKAYRMLEEEGILSSRAGAKSCVCVDEAQIARLRTQLLEAEAGPVIKAMKEMGLPRAEAFRLLEALWDKEEEEGVDA